MWILGNIKSFHSAKFRFTFTHVYIHAPKYYKGMCLNRHIFFIVQLIIIKQNNDGTKKVWMALRLRKILKEKHQWSRSRPAYRHDPPVGQQDTQWLDWPSSQSCAGHRWSIGNQGLRPLLDYCVNWQLSFCAATENRGVFSCMSAFLMLTLRCSETKWREKSDGTIIITTHERQPWLLRGSHPAWGASAACGVGSLWCPHGVAARRTDGQMIFGFSRARVNWRKMKMSIPARRRARKSVHLSISWKIIDV